MSNTSGKINLSILEIQNAISQEGVINAQVGSKVESELKKIEDFAQTMEEENEDLKEKLEKCEGELEELEIKLKGEVSDAEDLEYQIYEQEQFIKQNALPGATLDDVNKNKILQNLHHNLSLEKLEQIQETAKLDMPKNIIYQEVSEFSNRG